MPQRKERAPPKEIDESQLIPGAIILFRLKGYPPWPAVVLTDEHIPSQVRNVKPQSKAYPIRFFPFVKPEYAWANPKSGEIHGVLTKEEIDSFVENPKKGTSKLCLQAYQAAAEPVNLDELKISEEEDEDVEMEDVGADEEEEGEEEEEDDAALEDIKDLYEDEDDEGTRKKRKRKVTDDGEQKAKKKKSSLVEQPNKKRKGKAEQNGTTTAPKERKNSGRKPKNTQAEEEAAAAKKKLGEKKKAEYRKKEIMYIRHRIQKALLDKSGKEPEEDELPHIVENLKKLADFNWITPAFISETKIHKVLKRVIALPTIPHDENHDIKSRATAILKQWTPHLDEIAKTEKKEGPSTSEEGVKKASSGSEAEKDIATSSGEPMQRGGEKAEPTKMEEASTLKPAKGTAAEESASAGPMAVDEKPSNEGKGEEPAAPEEDFVMVDSGGQVDELSQEKAAQKHRHEETPKSQETETREDAEFGTGGAFDGADGTAAPAVSGSSIVHRD